MLRRRLPAVLLACLAPWLQWGCGSEEATRAPAKPAGRATNVVLITIDTLRADALGVYGQELPTSPNLDRLAGEGVLFEQCVTSAPSTLPSHASILTGKQPYAHGVRANAGYQLGSENVSLAEVLRDAGYRTGAEIAASVIGRRTLLNQGFEQYRDLDSYDARPNEMRIGDEKSVQHERSASDVTHHGLDFITEHREAPFFLWLHYFDPHSLYRAPDAYHRDIPESPYHAEVRYADQHVGLVIGHLESLGLIGRTLVVVTSDHGEGLGEHEEETHSFYVYDSTMHVPLLFWGPNVLSAPRRVSSLVRTVDIAPTILELLGLPPLTEVQGVSLRPLLDGSQTDLGLTGYGESTEPLQRFGASILRFVRQGRWKYIHKVEPELYDLAADPDEHDDLASRTPERARELRNQLRMLVASAAQSESHATASRLEEVDPATAEQLEQLGYVTTPVPEFDELASLEVSGPDATTLAGDSRTLGLGMGLLKIREFEAAETAFREVYGKHPQSYTALALLVKALRNQGGREAELEPLLRAGIELGGSSVDFHVDLSRMLAKKGNAEAAEALLLSALDIQPCSVTSRVHLASLLHEEERYADQISTLEQGLERCPHGTDLANDLAYALATVPPDGLRDGTRALALAERAVAEASGNPAYLDTLAAALAETGDYPRAVEASRRAVALLESREAPESVLVDFRTNLESFETQSPLRH